MRQSSLATRVPAASEDRSLRDLFAQAKSVAVIGASNDTSRPGGRALLNLLSGEFVGDVYAVNRRGGEIQGLQAVTSLADLPTVPDLVFVAVAKQAAIDLIHECGQLGVRLVVIASSGFVELGTEEGAALQVSLHEAITKSGVRVVGPNCQGLAVASAKSGTIRLSHSTLLGAGPDDVLSTQGSAAWLSQSGAVGAAAAQALAEYGVGLRYWMSTGNEVDVDICDLLELVIDDDAVTTICGYVEDIRRPRTFRALAEEARRRGKAIVLVKGGSGQAGARSAATHTGSLAGDANIYRGFFEQCGVIQCETIDQLAAVCGLRPANYLRGVPRQAAVLSNSGGFGVMLADNLELVGLDVPMLQPTDTIAELLPAFVRPSNPLDVATLPTEDRPRLDQVAAEFFGAHSQDFRVACFVGARASSGWDVPAMMRSLAQIQDTGGSPIVVCFAASEVEARNAAIREGLAVFVGLDRFITALRTILAVAPAEQSPAAAQPGTAGQATPLHTHTLTESRSKTLLAARGLPVPPGESVRDRATALAVARQVGYPVVAKLDIPGLTHKSRVGGVELKIEGDEQFHEAWSRLESAAQAVDVTGHDLRVLVERQVASVAELVVGAKRDATFGTVVMLGRGGVDVETMGLISWRVWPVTPVDIRDVWVGTGVWKELTDAGLNPAGLVNDFHGLIEAAVGPLSEATDDDVEIDLNPVMVTAGGDLWLADALLVGRSSEHAYNSGGGS